MTVSLKEAKNFLRVDHNEDDSLIRSYIYAAESGQPHEKVEEICYN